MTVLEVKICPTCKESKSLYIFTSKTGRIRSECKPCSALKSKEYRKKNPQKVAEYNKFYFQEKNPTYYRDMSRDAKDRRALKELKRKNKKREEINFNRRKRRDTNKEYLKYKKPRRNTLKVRSLGGRFKLELKDFYSKCPEGKNVDHIVPIINEQVSGLHVPWNLQYLTVNENSLKATSFDGTQQNDSWTYKLKWLE